jgi:hypothetical protein
MDDLEAKVFGRLPDGTWFYLISPDVETASPAPTYRAEGATTPERHDGEE